MSLEKSIISYCFYNCKSLPLVFDKIDSECFTDIDNQKCYEAIIALDAKEVAPDEFSINNYLKKSKLPEIPSLYFDELTEFIDTDESNWEEHCDILAGNGTKHRLNHLLLLTKSQLENNPDEIQVLANLSESVHNLQNKIHNTNDISVQDESEKLTERIKMAKAGKLKTFRLGIKAIDEIYEFDKGDLIILGARPGMGKTALLMASKTNSARLGLKPCVVSIEMTFQQLLVRDLSREMKVDGNSIKKGFVEWDKYNTALKEVQSNDFTVLPNVSDFDAIKAFIIKKVQNGCEIVYIDYLGIMTRKTKYSRHDLEVASITRDLKLLATKLDVPIVLLCQLSRQVESRPDKRPYNSDLRDSGSIEQDADSILFIYRDEYYGIMEDEEGNSTENKAEIIISKNRHGATGTASVDFIKEFAMFPNVTDKLINYAPQESTTLKPNIDF